MKDKKITRNAIRHGEVLLLPVEEIPANAKRIYKGGEYVVGHSETGHHHVAVGDLAVFGAGEKLFLKVNKDSRVEHRKSFDKHETKTLFKGLYTVVIKKSYDYFAKVMANVRD